MAYKVGRGRGSCFYYSVERVDGRVSGGTRFLQGGGVSWIARGGYRVVGGDESAVEFIKPKGFGSIYAYRTN